MVGAQTSLCVGIREPRYSKGRAMNCSTRRPEVSEGFSLFFPGILVDQVIRAEL
jgi:hypothetical protein